MPASKREQWFHRLFLLVVIGRGIYGVFEILIGLLLLLTSSVVELAHVIVQGELSEDPTDIVALYVNDLTNTWSLGIPTFVVTYLLSYGVVKVFLSISLLRKKFWAYPTAIGLFVLFLLYQVYRITETHSLVLTVITFTDLIAVLLIAHEYYHIRKSSTEAELPVQPKQELL